jgi:hypothetical protein
LKLRVCVADFTCTRQAVSKDKRNDRGIDNTYKGWVMTSYLD